MTIEQLYDIYLAHPNIVTDTRKLQKGDLFFALKGPSFNGNAFAQQALDAGAAYAIIDEAAYATSDKTILFDDVLSTLQQLAKHHRQQFNIPFIAITGSNGKTTTKELVHVVLRSILRTSTTEGNLNNHIGIPLTILKIKKDAEIAVIEMGANHQKEIEGYCQYALPTYGIINNCGKAHLEGFGGVEGVRKGKGELYDFIRATNGHIFRFNDYAYLVGMSKGIENVLSYGTHDADICGHILSNEPFLTVGISKGADIAEIKTQLVGEYNLPNVLVAVAVGKHFGVTDEKIKAALEAYAPSNSRSQMLQQGSNTIILDAYNANPSSMQVAIENFAKMHADKKVLLLGGMREMGDESIAEHTALVQLIQQHKWHQVVLVGTDFDKVPHPFLYFNTSTEAGEWLKAQAFENTYLLIKGSRGVAMEKAIMNDE
jgi:UDP-N-acetylmuramoyl-tripeptide--D-alanyl-D-alanine ligase